MFVHPGQFHSSSEMVNDLDLGPRLVKLCLQNICVAGFSDTNAYLWSWDFWRDMENSEMMNLELSHKAHD